MSVTNTTWVWNNKVTLWVFKGLSNAPLLFWWRSQNQRVTRTTHDLGGSNAIRSDFVPIYYGNYGNGKGFPAYHASPKFGFPIYIYILCCNSKNPVFSFGKTKRGLKFVDKVDDRRVDSRDHPFRVSLDLQSSHSWIQWIPLAAFPRTSKN